MFEFANPSWLWSLLIIPCYLAWEIFYKWKRRATISFSRLNLLKEAAGHHSWLAFLPLAIRVLIIASLLLSLARPRLAHKMQEVMGQGIDIIMAIDVSGSMKAVDFRPKNRLSAAKKVAKKFIEKRHNDRIGLVEFSDYAFTKCPLTLDYNILSQVLDDISINEEASGTAIGMGLATSVARMKDSEAKSKVIILITDGRNNAGEVDPVTAADLAATFGIKVYPIGVGQKDYADYPVTDAFGRTTYRKMKVDVDMETLNKIAATTGTEIARRAHNSKELAAILERINQLEKYEIKMKNYYKYNELFYLFLYLALAFILAELIYVAVLHIQLP